jgi:NOL1/NOP2/fmu family ribosome biogenesis protein
MVKTIHLTIRIAEIVNHGMRVQTVKTLALDRAKVSNVEDIRVGLKNYPLSNHCIYYG